MGRFYTLILVLLLLNPLKASADMVDTNNGLCTRPRDGLIGNYVSSLFYCLNYNRSNSRYVFFDGVETIYINPSSPKGIFNWGRWLPISDICPPGHELDRITGKCNDTLPKPEKNLGTTQCKRVGFTATGNPINQGTGNKLQLETDYTAPGLSPLAFQRYYNSTPIAISNRMGINWQFSYARSINVIDTQNAKVIRDDGKAYQFRKIYDVWLADLDVMDKLTELTT
ncbi:MAG: hypothetical protein CTY29_13150, partial [Methylobacter sp.]